jgi:hypothetical protein
MKKLFLSHGLAQCARRILASLPKVVELLLAAAVVWFAYRMDALITEQVEVLRAAKELTRLSTDQTARQADILAKATELLRRTSVQNDREVEILDKATALLKQATDQSSQQVTVLAAAADALRQVTTQKARDDFNDALDSADNYCCSTCAPGSAPNYLIVIPLDRAVQAEKKAEPILTAAEYNRLAMLGSSVWELSKTEHYLTKAASKSPSAIDQFHSHLVLGHVYYSHLQKGAELSKAQRARQQFDLAVAALLNVQPTNDEIMRLTGEAYAVRSSHERFLGYDVESSDALQKAKAHWSKLPDTATLTTDWIGRIAQAGAGIRPQVSCLFKSPVRSTPITLLPPVPEIPVAPPRAIPAPGTP